MSGSWIGLLSKSVKYKLALILVGFALVPSFVLGQVSFLFAKNLSMSHRMNVESLASTMAKKVEEIFPIAAKSMELLSNKSEFSDVSSATPGTEIISISEALQEASRSQKIFSKLVTTESQGYVVGAHEPGSPLIGKQFPKSVEFEQALGGKMAQTQIKEHQFFGEMVTGFWTFFPVYSAWDKNSAIGVNAAFQDVTALISTFREARVEDKPQDNSSYLKVYGHDGEVLFAPAFKGVLTKQKKYDGLSFSQMGTLEGVKDSWGRKVVGYARTDTAGLLITYFVDEDLVFRNISKLRGFLFAALGGTLLLSIAAVLPLSKMFTKPLLDLMEGAHKIGSGNLGYQVKVESNDEFGSVSERFNQMSTSLKESLEVIGQKNAELISVNENLEQTVEERTATIQTILNNVKSGFLIIDERLEIKEGFTKSCHQLLGKNITPGTPLSVALGLCPKDAGNLVLLMEQVFEDILPVEMSLGQIPSRFSIGEKNLGMEGSPLYDKEKIVGILFTLTDVTDLERAEYESHLNKTLVRILQQRDAFCGFLGECKTTLKNALEASYIGNEGVVRAALHTLKGNSASFGLKSLAAMIHQLEEKSEILPSDIKETEMALAEFLSRHKSILGIGYEDESAEIFHVLKNNLLALSQDFESSNSLDEALSIFRTWISQVDQKPALQLLGPLPEFAETLAHRLGKNVRIDILGGGMLMHAKLVMPLFQNLTHLIRNSIDHGIEFPWERGNKAAEALLRVEFQENQSAWVVKVSDDGRGIDSQKIAQKAVERGLISPAELALMSEEAKVTLIFRPGLSTAVSVSDISGRGVGMSAVQEAVLNMGGKINVQTTPSKGSTFCIEIPKPVQAGQIASAQNFLRTA